MQYKWNINNLQKKLLIAKILKFKKLIEYYENIIEQANLEKKADFNKEDILLIDKLEEIDFVECLNTYIRGLSYIPDELYESMLDLFTWFEDLESLNNIPQYKQINLSNKDLITLSHDIIASMHNKQALKIFNILLKDKNLLNIQTSGDNTTTQTERLGGLTYTHPYSRKSHVNIFRTNTIEDIEIFVHESLHFIYNYLLHYYYKKPNIHMLSELEGEYGSIYTANYLDQINFEDAKLLKKDQINSILNSSFLLMVNHTLFKTANNKEFILHDTENELNKIFKNIKIKILPNELSSYLTISGYEKITDMISFLVALELTKKYEPTEALQKIYILKTNDSHLLLTNLRNENIEFHDNGYKDFIKEYKLTHN